MKTATKTYEVNANGNRSYSTGKAKDAASVAVEWSKQGHSPELFVISDDDGIQIRQIDITTVAKTAKALSNA